jgi:hypothetical protein
MFYTVAIMGIRSWYDVNCSEDIWRLCWQHGTTFPIYATNASIAVFLNPSGTVTE